MSDVLDGIERIDWSGVQSNGVDGSQEVALQLRRIAEGADDAGYAWSRLHELVITHEHSASIVASAEFVIPFLIRLCGSSRRGTVRHSLFLLARVTPEAHQYESDPDLYERIQATIGAGRAEYERLLDAPDPDTRELAADLLALLDRPGQIGCGWPTGAGMLR